ncbi:MAG TPA: hypothetical protein VGH28_13900 [Polyangiaceae bacterium]|jgi:hypothetical protein
MALPQYETGARLALSVIRPNVASVAALAALGKDECIDGRFCAVQDGTQGTGSEWMFSAASAAVADGQNLLAIAPSSGSGMWLRADKLVDLKIPVGFGDTDAQVLLTVPAGFRLRIQRAFWEVTTSFTGGASSAIGLSSSDLAYATKGDLLGGASGDIAATLVSNGNSVFVGTAGAKTAGAAPVVLVAGDTILFNRITSAFTAGAGFAHVLAEMAA